MAVVVDGWRRKVMVGRSGVNAALLSPSPLICNYSFLYVKREILLRNGSSANARVARRVESTTLLFHLCLTTRSLY